MKIARTILSGLLLALILPLDLSAQSNSSEEIKQAEDRWIAAIKANDRAGLGKILSNDLVYTHSSGLVEDKSQYITAIISGKQKYVSVDYEDPEVRTYGNTGVVATKARITGSTKGVPFNHLLRLLHVWVKQEGDWVLVAHQTTRLP
jgi:ketosteroid isomerase-like protein